MTSATSKITVKLEDAYRVAELEENEVLLINPNYQDQKLVRAVQKGNLFIVEAHYLLRYLFDDPKKFTLTNIGKPGVTNGYRSAGNYPLQFSKKIFGINSDGIVFTLYESGDLYWPHLEGPIEMSQLQDSKGAFTSNSIIRGGLLSPEHLNHLLVSKMIVKAVDSENKFIFQGTCNNLEYFKKVDPTSDLSIDTLPINSILEGEIDCSNETITLLSKRKNDLPLDTFHKIWLSYLTTLSIMKPGNVFQTKEISFITSKGFHLKWERSFGESKYSHRQTFNNWFAGEDIVKIVDWIFKNENIRIAVIRISHLTGQAEPDFMSSYAVYEAAWRICKYPVDEEAIELNDQDKEQGLSLTQARVVSVLEKVLSNEIVQKYFKSLKSEIYEPMMNPNFVKKFVRDSDLLRNKVAHHNFAKGLKALDFYYRGLILRGMYYLWILIEAESSEESLMMYMRDIQIHDALEYLSYTIDKDFASLITDNRD